MELDEWREYYVHEGRKRLALEKKRDRARKNLDLARQRVVEAELVGVSPDMLLVRLEELVWYDNRISQRRKEADLARKRLDVLREQAAFSAVAKEMLISQAEDDLQSAQRTLQAEILDEMEEMNKQVKSADAREALTVAQGRVDSITICLEQLDALVEWVAGQILETDPRYTLRWHQHDHDLLDSWTEYYIHMRDRLTSGHARGDDDPWIEQMHPDKTKKRLQALLIWIERALPDFTLPQPNLSSKTPSRRMRKSRQKQAPTSEDAPLH
jgi:hypothetical protein